MFLPNIKDIPNIANIFLGDVQLMAYNNAGYFLS